MNTLLQSIEYHRAAALEVMRCSPGWYFHERKAALLVREWRKTNSLTVIACQIADKNKPAD